MILRKLIRTAIVSILTALAVAPASAFAGGRIGLLGGGGFSPDTIEFVGDYGPTDLDLKGGPALGLEGGWKIDDSVEIGATLLGAGLFSSSVFDSVGVASATAGARYSFRPKESLLRPFVIGQMGYYNVSIDEAHLFDFTPYPDKDEGGFGLNVGGGLDVFPLSWLSVGVDLRYHRAFVYDGVGYFSTMLGAAVHFG